MDDTRNFNRVRLCGQILAEPALSHVNHGESFYKFSLAVKRLSGQADILTVIASQHLLRQVCAHPGSPLCVVGQLRSFNNKSGLGSRLVISIFAQSLTPCSGEPFNQIQLSGILCKAPTLRRTPLGRSICDVILAVNRRYGRADYLPCIGWGLVAQQVGNMHVGERLTLEGRVQSRTYTKNTGAQAEERIAYEVSIMHLASPEDFTGEEDSCPEVPLPY
ncbi:MAG: single-stranded DNA-binding protein [Clostridiales bacterium]|nr:single-stranded DNA-binding protein [Clostridiales bacterium]